LRKSCISAGGESWCCGNNRPRLSGEAAPRAIKRVALTTLCGFTHTHRKRIFPNFNDIAKVLWLHFSAVLNGEPNMQALITFITVLGGLLLSLAVAIVVEEFIFGQIFRLFFTAPKPSARPVLVRLTAQGHQ
jgi:hypothetical protein